MIQQPPAMRIKSRWFSGDGAPVQKSAAEHGSAMAFIVWRVAVQMLKRMRAADFDIEAGAPYFDFVREVLVFLVVVADRIAYERLVSSRPPEPPGQPGQPEPREQFVVALVRHVARHLQENADDLLGPPPPGEPGHGERFIDLFNELAGHYAEFGAAPGPTAPAAGFQPDFAFVRYLGVRLEPALPEHHRRWVLDQVMAIEAPEALEIVQRSMRELFDPAPPPRRAGGGRRGTLTGD
ncbi:MAG: hypothetical protein HZC37_10545 [Burkholderiales bacterium]|nr:hypothetical protein [Burkholderiales bacterium]